MVTNVRAVRFGTCNLKFVGSFTPSSGCVFETCWLLTQLMVPEKNTYSPDSTPDSALAALFKGGMLAVYKCNFIGLKDTVCDFLGRHYFKGCRFKGNTDFVFGFGQSLSEVLRCYLLYIAKVVAKQEGLEDGYRVVINDGPSGYDTALSYLQTMSGTDHSTSMHSTSPLIYFTVFFTVMVLVIFSFCNSAPTQKLALLQLSLKKLGQVTLMTCKSVKYSWYVVDAADHDNLSISNSELHDLISKPSLYGIPLLILGNKTDKPEALSKEALVEAMGLKRINDREVCCFMISCKNSTNIDVVIDWLVKHSKSKN